MCYLLSNIVYVLLLNICRSGEGCRLVLGVNSKVGFITVAPGIRQTVCNHRPRFSERMLLRHLGLKTKLSVISSLT